jgi:hypothetical protein
MKRSPRTYMDHRRGVATLGARRDTDPENGPWLESRLGIGPRRVRCGRRRCPDIYYALSAVCRETFAPFDP